MTSLPTFVSNLLLILVFSSVLERIHLFPSRMLFFLSPSLSSNGQMAVGGELKIHGLNILNIISIIKLS